MIQLLKPLLSFLVLMTFLLSGCTSSPKKEVPLIKQSTQERLANLQQLTQWRINGKIAFIETNKRNSATLSWRVNELEETQKLSLTSYLGINVLQLESNKNQHTLQVDGKTYQESNLDMLIYSLTGLTLPTKALSYWLKAIPFQATDVITYQESTKLPDTLSSYYNNELWQVRYSNYQQIGDYSLAKKLSIQKGDLLIKIAINTWALN